MSVEPGQNLLHYRLIEKIGEGGMGVVWKAEDTKLHRNIALKVLPQKMADDPDRRARFEREARAVAALNHPNIVTLHSVERAETSDGALHFITMELVEGRNLTQLLPKNGFPLERLLEIAIPLADAVSRAHRAGITHRDLKPDNIMIDHDGRLRVLDFGLAKLQETAGTTPDTQVVTVTSDTAEGRVLGTVAYMSPEQAEGKEVDTRSDIFSMGTILYEMFTGGRPFRGDTTMSTIGSILKDEPSSVTDLKPMLPRHAARILRRCLAKDPDRRYQTALDLRNELEELRDDEQPTVAQPRRRAWPVPVAAVALIVLAVVVTIQVVGKDPTPPVYFSQPITATLEWDSGPVWSPDGEVVAFDRMSRGDSDIYIKPVAGGEEVARASLPGEQMGPRWTPDGHYLTFVSRHLPGNPVMLVPADGGEPTELIKTNMHTLAFEGPPMGVRPWSPDGKTLLLSLETETGSLAIHRVDRETGQAEQMTFPPEGAHDSIATYSFDGERILFRRLIEVRAGLMLMPATGGDHELLYETSYEEMNAAWRPDNRRVVFNSDNDTGIAGLFEIDTKTRRVRQLTNLNEDIYYFDVSLGDRIIYSTFEHDQFIFVVDRETRAREQITSHARRNHSPTFSPDGRKLAYASDRTGNWELWVRDLESGSGSQFTFDPAEDKKPEWSPDGSRILFISDRDGGQFKLFVANTDRATEPRLLVDQPLHYGQGNTTERNNRVAQWSPDGTVIAYRVMGESGPELWTVDANGSNPRKRLDGASGFDWYLDGGRALYTRMTGTEEELVAIDLETGQERSLLVGPLQEIDVAPDGHAVSFGYGQGHLSLGLAVLKLDSSSDPDGLPVAVGEPEYVVPTGGTWHVHYPTWSPDMKKFVYVQDEDFGDLYELVEKP